MTFSGGGGLGWLGEEPTGVDRESEVLATVVVPEGPAGEALEPAHGPGVWIGAQNQPPSQWAHGQPNPQGAGCAGV